MEGRDIMISLAVLIIILFVASSSFMGKGTNIASAIADKYPLKTTEDGVKTYNSDRNLNSTINDIVAIKKPYDQKVDPSRVSILLYDEAVVVVKEESGTTGIEVIKNHQTAYNRYHNTMIFFWGSNIFHNGRIRTPRSIRNGSIGSSPSRGGGFGFGK